MPPAEDVRYGLSLAAADPASVTAALASSLTALARQPAELARALTDLSFAQAGVARDVALTALDAGTEPGVRPDRDDRRFDDRAWRENPFLLGILESYLVGSRWARDLVASAEVPERTRLKAQFALGLLLDALSPSNVPWLNPAVVKEAYDTGGRSLVRGFANFLHDVAYNSGQPRQVDRSAFEVGRDLAATPGRVVLRTDLFELLAYEPRTERVHATPVVYVPPWINKYYVLDLAPGRSFVEFAVAQGFTVFAISWRNADASMRDLTLDDYVRDGVLTALERASELTRSEAAGVVSVCVGGTLAASALGILAARGEVGRVAWASLFNAPVDFSDPGPIGVFTDEQAVARIEERISRRGYMEPSEVGGPFTLLRGNDLVWRYVVSNWQMGREPERFDILAWNADGMRLPARMHAQYLRACYVENRLARPGGLVIDGTPVDLGRVRTPLYVLGSEADHIVPWRSSYRTTQLVRGRVRHALTSGGHIAGLLSVPGSAKARYRVSDECPPDADAWLAAAEERRGSWWEDWVAWAAPRAGELVPPPALPQGEPAPGRYVHS